MLFDEAFNYVANCLVQVCSRISHNLIAGHVSLICLRQLCTNNLYAADEGL